MAFDSSILRLYSSKDIGEMPTFYEFFAGGGMARAGLGRDWSCLIANDIDSKKGAAYAANWGGQELILRDVSLLSASELPGKADLAWASFF
jgi:DNA (cytosine-5)-methyltransferase 1